MAEIEDKLYFLKINPSKVEIKFNITINSRFNHVFSQQQLRYLIEYYD